MHMCESRYFLFLRKIKYKIRYKLIILTNYSLYHIMDSMYPLKVKFQIMLLFCTYTRVTRYGEQRLINMEVIRKSLQTKIL